jgi:hypothetical protein
MVYKPKMPFSGFGSGFHLWAWLGNFFVGLGNVLRVFGVNIIVALKYGPIVVYFFAHKPFLCMINKNI